MSSDRMESVVARLEAVTTRLESCCGKCGGDSGPAAAFIEPFEQLLNGSVKKFVVISTKIDAKVGEGAKLMEKGFATTLNLLKMVSNSKKPSDQKMVEFLKPLSDVIEEIKDFCSKNFKSDFKAHFDSISNFSPALGWIPAQLKPQGFVNDIIESGMFYSNRVLTSFKDKGPDHKEWAGALVKCFKDLSEYCSDFHPTGCSWNPKGAEVGDSKGAAATPATSAAPAAAATTSAKPVIGALFSELNKGTGITSGLKKVDDSQKTHKNPSLRAGVTVAETATPKDTTTAKASTPAKQLPPVFELQGKKWAIENQKNQEMMEIKEGDMSYSVSLWKCVNTNVKIPMKVNTVTLDACKNCKVQFVSGLIASCDVINSSKIEIHADDQVPFITLNSVESCQIYLSEKTYETKVSTATSTSVNVCTWSKDSELTERPIPYQFVSRLKDGKLITEAAEDI